MRLLLRGYATLFHLAITGAMGLLGLIGKLSDTTNLKLDFLPWTGADLITGLLLSGALGLLAVALSVTRIFPWMLPVNCLLLAILLYRGFFWLPFKFNGWDDFYWAAALVAGAVGAFLSSAVEFRKNPTKKK